jgi:cysteine desulfuration protein SufE
MNPEEIAEDFAWLDAWDDRYGYLIDLGRGLPPMEMADKTEENKIEGCQSGVWIRTDLEAGSPPKLLFAGDSDSAIVKGLVAIVLSLVNGRTPQEIVDVDIKGFFTKLKLENHLSPTRKTGLNAMVQTIKARAATIKEAGI